MFTRLRAVWEAVGAGAAIAPVAVALALGACRPDAGRDPVEPGPASTADTAPATGDTARSTGDTSTDRGGSPGDLVSVSSLGAFDRAALRPWVSPEVDLRNGYEVFVVAYLTEGLRLATGTVTLPFDDAEPPPSAGYPIVVNAHGTVGLDDPCRLSGTVSGTGLAGLFGARGAIGVAPDYLGLGGPGRHRYLDAADEAFSVLDAIRAAGQLAADQGVAHSGRSAVVGLSQGGHASLSAAAWHSRYAPELDIRAFAAAAPASVFVEHWRAGVQVPGSHLVLHAMLATSFAEAAGADPSALWAPGFDPEPHLSTRCGWSLDFSGGPTLYDDFPQVADRIFAADVLEDYVDGSFTSAPFLAERFAANRVVPWLDQGQQTAPIAVWQGSDDAVVLAGDTADLVASLRAGGIDVDLHVVPGGTHTDTAFGFLAVPERATDESVAWVLGHLR